MIPIVEIKTAITEGISASTGLIFKEIGHEADTAETEYLVFSFSSMMNSRGFPVVEYGDGIMRQSETVSFTASIFSYSQDKLPRIINAMKARDWVDRIGRMQLKDGFDCVVVNVGPVITRDYKEYENAAWIRREGFDVQFRMVDVTETEVEMIETVNIKGADRIVTN
ncbi:LIC_12616 family protein [Paenibacillus caui]|uniref:phage neck terminator protein n=1 Tax=Paenibacillus caui TaxID=2873927 RepID=UPI001CA82CC7|nr:hypothetical protein [Paenibacillus caui]